MQKKNDKKIGFDFIDRAHYRHTQASQYISFRKYNGESMGARPRATAAAQGVMNHCAMEQ